MLGEAKSSSLLKAVRSLHFNGDRVHLLESIQLNEWDELLRLTDDARISLPLATRRRSAIPPCIRDRLDRSLVRNHARHARVLEAYSGIAEAMKSYGAEFVVLKGLTHGTFWSRESFPRPQSDIDLYCPPEYIEAALKAATSLGYEPIGSIHRNSDHLPVMIRRTGWRWSGDYYDPNQPLALELHHRFWSPEIGFRVYGAERFWKRRRTMISDGIELPTLHPVDILDYAAWHAVRHLLHANLRISHIYELASHLDLMADDPVFWSEWRKQGAPSLRLAESIAFRVAEEWFGCRMHPIPASYAHDLPSRVERWFRLFAFSPITAIGRPNKDELILNLCLAESNRERCRIAARRIFPLKVPPRLEDAHAVKVTLQLRIKRRIYSALFIARRAVHHLRSLLPVIRSGLRWWLSPSLS